jgi:protein-S-isoprenylcysteine O-methyltransferase Ste14
MNDRQHFVFTALQIFAVVAGFWFLFTWKTPWNGERYAGIMLALVGVSGIFLARYQLGRSFSITPQAHHLVTTGLYSKIRNPIYVSGTVMIAGFILVLQLPALWIVLAVLVIGQTIRARREARVLEAAFGDEYREYRRKTWF